MKIFVEFNNGKFDTYCRAKIKEDTRGFWIIKEEEHSTKIFIPLYNINKITMVED